MFLTAAAASTHRCFLCAGHCPKCSASITSLMPNKHPLARVITSPCYRPGNRPREIQWSAQGHIARKWQSQDSKEAHLFPDPVHCLLADAPSSPSFPSQGLRTFWTLLCVGVNFQSQWPHFGRWLDGVCSLRSCKDFFFYAKVSEGSVCVYPCVHLEHNCIGL